MLPLRYRAHAGENPTAAESVGYDSHRHSAPRFNQATYFIRLIAVRQLAQLPSPETTISDIAPMINIEIR
jgi:hypothetical protein